VGREFPVVVSVGEGSESEEWAGRGRATGRVEVDDPGE